MRDKKENEKDLNAPELEEEVLGSISGGWGGISTGGITACRVNIVIPDVVPGITPCSDMSPCQDSMIDSCIDTNIDYCVDVPITTCLDLDINPSLDPNIIPCGLDVSMDGCALDANCTGYVDIGVCNSDALGVCGLDASITACLSDSAACTADIDFDVCRGDASDLYGDFIDPNICIGDIISCVADISDVCVADATDVCVTDAFDVCVTDATDVCVTDAIDVCVSDATDVCVSDTDACSIDTPVCAGYGGAGVCPDNPCADMPVVETCPAFSNPSFNVCLLDTAPGGGNGRGGNPPGAGGW